MKINHKHLLVIGALLLAANAIFVWPHQSQAVLLDCSTAVNIVVPVQECQGLVDLYNQTNGPSWNNDLLWNTDSNVCNWHGVGCTSNRVTDLDLNTNNLDGTLPDSMSGLVKMRNLNLWGNNIYGTLPSAWSTMTGMSNFQIWNNDLTGTLPVSWSGWTIINTFEVDDNNLIGTLPSEWSTWRNVSNFHFSNNNFTGSVPASWSALTGSVLWINLGYNYLHGQIPASWTWLTNMIPNLGLVLTYNCFDTNHPEPPSSFIDSKAGTGWKLTQTCAPRATRTDLSILKNSTALTAMANSGITYTITYRNKNNTATGIFIVDTLPSNLNYVSASPAPDTVSGNTLVWNIGTLNEQASGTIILTGTISPNVNSWDTVINNVSISGYVIDNNSTNNSDGHKIDIIGGNMPTTDMIVTKTPTTASPEIGSPLTYTISYINSWVNNVTWVSIIDIPASGLVYNSAVPEADFVSTTGIVWNFSSLGAQETWEISVIFYVDPSLLGTPASNSVTISGFDNDPNGGNNTDSVDVTPVLGSGDIFIIKTANNPTPTIGVPFSYTLSSTSSGMGYMTGLTVSDYIPTGITYISASPAPDIISGNLLIWNNMSWLEVSPYDIIITWQIDNSVLSWTIITNTGYVTGIYNDFDRSNNIASVDIYAMWPVNNNSGGWGGGWGWGWGGGWGWYPTGTLVISSTGTSNALPEEITLGSAPVLDEDAACIYHDGDFEKFKTTFTDVQGTIFKSAVDLMLDYCLIQGYSNSGKTFGTYRYLKWAEAYKIFTRLAGLSFDRKSHPKHWRDMYEIAWEKINLWQSTSSTPHPANGYITLADVYTISNNLLKYSHKRLMEYDPTLKYGDGITRGKFALFIQSLINQLKE